MKTTTRSLNSSASTGTRPQPVMPGHVWTTAAAALLALFAGAGGLPAADLQVPNGSFESPTPPPGFPAYPLVDSWQKSAQPAWFDPTNTGGITWQQLSGVFPNTSPSSPDHIDNMTGNQAAYMFALPEVALFQELTSTFQVGLAYNLTVGILGAGGVTEGSSFALSLYYRDGANQPVPLAATPITYSAAGFPSVTHLIDFGVSLPAVQAGDAWAGQNIGIQLLSTFGTGAGYWDLDNVRLVAVPEPAAAGLLAVGLGAWLLIGLLARRRRAVARGRDT